MKKIFVIAIIIFNLPNITFGCTCYSIKSFDIQNYDRSTDIAEIKVIEKLEDDYKNRLAQYKKDTTGWDKAYPPIPLLPPNNFTGFNVEVVQVFKGNLKLGQIKIIATEKNSSCYWEPELGKNYIFYFHNLNEDDKKPMEIGACRQRTHKDSKNFASEVEALRILKEKKQGKFKIDQSDLLDASNTPYHTIKGKFKNGKRHGKWIIAEPVDHSKKENEPRRKTLILKYKNGNLVSVKYTSPYNSHIERNFTWYWKNYYEERKQ